MNDMDVIKNYGKKERCIQGNLPPCSCACPVNFQVRDFIKKMRSGNINGAYREMANSMIFPGITPYICEGGCVGHCLDEIDMPALERACVNLATKKTPNNYVIPRQDSRIAVIGGGLAGLACALRLASKRYRVTLFERTDRIGGGLIEVMKPESYLAEFELQFRYAPYSVEYNRTILSLDELSFDAIVIATGRGGNDFGLLNEWNPESMSSGINGVFLCGRLSGASHMEALAQGSVAASSVERYLKTGNMSGEKNTFIVRHCKLPQKEKTSSFPNEAKMGISSKEDAVNEALRCSMCDCTACYDHCEFLRAFKLSPKQIERNALAGVIANMGLLEHDALSSRMIYSCGLCGHCRGVCPENLPIMEEFMLQNKLLMFQEGDFAPALHDFYIRDMENAMGENYFTRPAPGYSQAAYVLFPGCQVAASNPQYVGNAYEYLLNRFPDTALSLGCCGIPSLWAGNWSLFQQTLTKLRDDWRRLGDPIVVLLCPTCVKTFDRYLPEMNKVSLYELMCKHGLPKSTGIIHDKQAIFDPCSSRDFPSMQNSVRELAKEYCAELEELEDSGKRARCCGMSGHIYPSYPELGQKSTERAVMLSDSQYVVYCVNCRNFFLREHKKCVHILDELFELTPLEKPPHIAQMRANRSLLKEQILYEVWGEETTAHPREKIPLEIREDILDKMDKSLISEDEVMEVIRYCEETGDRLADMTKGTILGHLQIGIITYWVEYRRGNGSFELVNAYCHRMHIKR